MLKTKFKKWSNNISSCKAQIPKSIPLKKESVPAIALHVFGDANVIANCAAFYAPIY